MSERFAYSKRAYYPHMKPNDIAIWERFIEQFPDAYKEVEYDVAVGSLPNFDTTVSEAERTSMELLYKKKIDVVGHIGGQIDIIELKPRATPSSIGQLLSYGLLYERDIKPSVRPKLVLITDQLLPDMAELAAAQGVLIIVV